MRSRASTNPIPSAVNIHTHLIPFIVWSFNLIPVSPFAAAEASAPTGLPELSFTLFALLCLYLLFVSRGFRIGYSGPDDFGKLLAVGISFVIALQCFIVIGGVMRVIPNTGLTTPFLAAGGSSLVANWMIAALLLRISDTIRSGPRTVI